MPSTDISDALMKLEAHVPDDAMTAELLGTERSGIATRIRADGLSLTISYLCVEAQTLWMTAADGKTSAAHVIAEDTESGLALVKPDNPLGPTCVPLATVNELSNTTSIMIYNRIDGPSIAAQIAAVGAFSGRWEYLIENAIYTVPACDEWSGAALCSNDGQLIGVGSLLLQLPGRIPAQSPGESDSEVYGNLFVPTELITNHVDHLYRHGRRSTPARPWLGWMIQDDDGPLVVVGLYPDGPAILADVQLTDVITAIDDQPVHSLADLYHAVWTAGPAGTQISITLKRNGVTKHIKLDSVGRNEFFIARTVQQSNRTFN
ncbi:MAG: signal protein PDZ [marine bacterium B5-7]|nr:MAG: signal protein PDZ [marine bacterium B5-7]